MIGSPQSTLPPIIPLDLDEASRKLIREAAPNAVEIEVAGLDKGLSGATVWLAEWSLNYGARSAPHVLKIDSYDRLRAEKQRVDEYVASVDPATGHIALLGPAEVTGAPPRGLLRQAYIGNSRTGPLSLRHWIQQRSACGGDGAGTIEDRQRIVREKVRQLYNDRMRLWHESSRASNASIQCSIGRELERRLKHIDKLETTIQALGPSGLIASINNRELASLDRLKSTVEEILKTEERFPYGLIHGDLHSQNILIDAHEQIHLIDFAWAGFGWRALDFLMLECSIKFLVAPNDAGMDDLLEVERLLDNNHGKDEMFMDLDDRICGSELRIIAAALSEIRRLALELSAANNIDQYRRGLVAMSATLGGYPQLHRSFLVHSLCYHAKFLG